MPSLRDGEFIPGSFIPNSPNSIFWKLFTLLEDKEAVVRRAAEHALQQIAQTTQSASTIGKIPYGARFLRPDVLASILAEMAARRSARLGGNGRPDVRPPRPDTKYIS